MLSDFFPLLMALAAALTVYILRERHRQRTRVNPARPDLTMSEAWELWKATSDFQAPEEVQTQARASLLETERSLATAGGLHSLRLETLRSLTTSLYLETILELGETERRALLRGYQEGMEPLVRAVIGVNTVRWRVLREYGRLKYDDAVPDDWFHHYLRVAAPYIREKVRLSREFLLDLDPGAARWVEIYDQLLRDLQTSLVDSPRKKRYVPPDLAA